MRSAADTEGTVAATGAPIDHDDVTDVRSST